MGQRGVSPLLTAVLGDLTVGLCAEVAPPARIAGCHLTLVPRSACPPGRGAEPAESSLTVIEAGLEDLSHTLDELARLQIAPRLGAV
jgi:hypothetical protein